MRKIKISRMDSRTVQILFCYANPESGKENVISKYANRFPQTNNMEESKNNIYNHKVCISNENYL